MYGVSRGEGRGCEGGGRGCVLWCRKGREGVRGWMDGC